MEKLTTILFDFDGTVMDTNALIYHSWQYTYKKLTGKPGSEAFIYGTYGELLEESMKKAFPDVDAKTSIEIYREYQRDCFEEEIQLFPGMEALIREVHRQQYRTALVTSRLRETTMQGLSHFGLEDCFSTIVTAEDTTEHKPKPGPILEAMRRLDVVSQECIMVGDSQFDMECAFNAHVKYAQVGWSIAGIAEDAPMQPDFHIKEAKDLLSFLDEASRR